MYATTFIATILAAATAVVAAPYPAPYPLPQNNDNRNSTGAADFGTCVPTMDFQLGRQGRKADQGTFLPLDPAILNGQSDALNPSIIMNRVCDQLNSRTCNANQAAIDECLSAKKQVEAEGTKDASTATLFNSLQGF